jgi:hypothetical protein
MLMAVSDLLGILMCQRSELRCYLSPLLKQERPSNSFGWEEVKGTDDLE